MITKLLDDTITGNQKNPTDNNVRESVPSERVCCRTVGTGSEVAVVCPAAEEAAVPC